MPVLARTERLSSRTLGDVYPYWWRGDGGAVHSAEFFDQAMNEFPRERRTLDPVAVLSILSLQYIALDRTLVQGLERLSWLGQIDGGGERRFEPAPPHGHGRDSASGIARKLRGLLEEEVLGYCEGKSKIYLMLSGGMDSRVMAGVVAALEKRNAIRAPIVAVTWGVEQSRDCRYAAELARYFGWEWRWAELDAEGYWRLFELCASDLGAEVDPKHLHRMDWFRDAEPDAVALAASYGDSVGRAEYSSLQLTAVPRLRPADRYRFLMPAVRERAWAELERDILAVRDRYGARSETGWREIERQSHYMRRMLCTTMGVINRWCAVRQVFTQPSIFGLMWSLDVSCRTGEPYVHLLRDLDPKLLDFAWARTGSRYDTGEGADASFSKRHHRYGYWLRSEHADKIADLLFNPTLGELGLFDLDQVRFMYDEWRRERPSDDTSLATQLSSLAVIALAARRFGISAPLPLAETPSSGLLRGAQGLLETQAARAYQVASRISRPWRL